MDHQIIQGDCIETLKTLASESVHCCVTSPPYFGLRDYGVSGQIGLEATPQKFIAAMVTVFEEVRRVLRPDGVLFLNLGDSYATGTNAAQKPSANVDVGGWNDRVGNAIGGRRVKGEGFKPKDLMLMPHRVAIALQEAGWWVRSDMPWVKRSAMPESVTDRPAKALEYVFMLTKSEKYFYDAEAVRVEGSGFHPGNKSHKQTTAAENGDEKMRTKGGLVAYAQKQRDTWKGSSFSKGKTAEHQLGRAQKDRDRSLPTNRNGITEHLDETPAGSRNFRNADLWFSSIKEPHGLVSLGDELVGLDVNPSGFKDAHFATFPPKLIEPLIKAGTSEHGCCAECGSPYERITESSYRNVDAKSGEAWSGNGAKSIAAGGVVGKSDVKPGDGSWTYTERTRKLTDTLGWQKTCKCESDERVPCTVLDCFNGAGTTMLVAKRLGRRSIGLELNPEYIKIAEHRLEHWHRSQPPKIEPETANHGPLFDLMQEVAA